MSMFKISVRVWRFGLTIFVNFRGLNVSLEFSYQFSFNFLHFTESKITEVSFFYPKNHGLCISDLSLSTTDFPGFFCTDG